MPLSRDKVPIKGAYASIFGGMFDGVNHALPVGSEKDSAVDAAVSAGKLYILCYALLGGWGASTREGLEMGERNPRRNSTLT